MQRILDAPFIQAPFPHLHVESVFDEETFGEILQNLPSPSTYKTAQAVETLGGFWARLNGLFDHQKFCEKLGVKADRFKLRLVRDHPGYSLGPHTDDPKKVFAFVFYLKGENGTSLYVPKKPGFEHDGRAHLSFDDFVKAKEIPFIPNSVGGFARTNTSFHGVEKTSSPRYTLLYNGFTD